jgi:hypothetical protein
MIFHTDLSQRLYESYKDRAGEIYEEAKDNSIGVITDNEPFSFYGGYPTYIDLPIRPLCTCCDDPTAFWLQIDSSEEFGLVFEDYGTLYLFKCEKTNEIRFIVQ